MTCLLILRRFSCRPAMSSATLFSTKYTARVLTHTDTDQPSQGEDSVASLIRSYITRERHTEKSPCLRVTEDIAESIKAINSLARRRAKYAGTYLTITPMPYPLHEAVSWWFWRTCTYNICALLNETEDWIESGMMYRILPGQCDGQVSMQIAHCSSTMSIKNKDCYNNNMYHRSVDGSPIRPTRADRRSAAAKLCFSP